MTQHLQKEILWPAQDKTLIIKSFCSPEEISSYTFDDQFGIHAQYKSLYTKKESLQKDAADPDTNVVLALVDNKHIIGFGVLAYPDPDERWVKLKPQIMIEILALEVCRKWRDSKVARGIIQMMLTHPKIEDKIAFLVGYCWTWDLDGTGNTAQEYRNMMIHLFEPYEFMEYQTNEPNISLKPENIFMGRIGKNVSPKTRNDFKWLRFGVDNQNS